jgi:hypothetical protein
LFSKILSPQEVLEILANPEDEILAMGVDGEVFSWQNLFKNLLF